MVAQATPRLVVLSEDGKQRYVLEGAAADAATFLVAVSGELNRHPLWQLTFDCGAGQVKPSLRKFYPAIKRDGRQAAG